MSIALRDSSTIRGLYSKQGSNRVSTVHIGSELLPLLVSGPHGLVLYGVLKHRKSGNRYQYEPSMASTTLCLVSLPVCLLQGVRVINGTGFAANANWLYVEWCTGEKEFYDAAKDPRMVN